MSYSKEENKDFALKLVLIEIQKLISKAQEIRRGLTNKELLKIIKDLEPNSCRQYK